MIISLICKYFCCVKCKMPLDSISLLFHDVSTCEILWVPAKPMRGCLFCKRRVIHKRREAQRGQDMCLCVWGCGAVVDPNKTHKIQQAGARYRVSVWCLLPRPRLAAEWLRGEALVCFTLNPLWKSLKEKSSIYPPALQRPAPNYPPTKLLKNNKNIWPGRTFDVATQCLTESRTALNREVCVNSPAPVQHLETRLGEANAIGLEAAVELEKHGFKRGRMCQNVSKCHSLAASTDMLHHNWQPLLNYTHN